MSWHKVLRGDDHCVGLSISLDTASEVRQQRLSLQHDLIDVQ
jgi:hypothetical protein